MGYVYKFINFYGEIIYVGKTNNLYQRMKQHFKNGHLPDECYQHIDKIFYCEVDGKTNTDMMETYIINKYQPLYNTDKQFRENIDKHNDKNVSLSEPTWKQLYIDFFDNDIILSETEIMPIYYQRNMSDREKCLSIIEYNIGRMTKRLGYYEKYINTTIDLKDMLTYFVKIHKEISNAIIVEDSNVDEPINKKDAIEYVAFNISSIKTINMQYLISLSNLHLIMHLFNDVFAFPIHNQTIMETIPKCEYL